MKKKQELHEAPQIVIYQDMLSFSEWCNKKVNSGLHFLLILNINFVGVSCNRKPPCAGRGRHIRQSLKESYRRLRLTDVNNAANNFVKICQSLSAIYKTQRNQGRADYDSLPPLSFWLEIATRIKTLPPPLSFPSKTIENSGDDVTLV